MLGVHHGYIIDKYLFICKFLLTSDNYSKVVGKGEQVHDIIRPVMENNGEKECDYLCPDIQTRGQPIYDYKSEKE